jgi:hypothetical protein
MTTAILFIADNNDSRINKRRRWKMNNRVEIVAKALANDLNEDGLRRYLAETQRQFDNERAAGRPTGRYETYIASAIRALSIKADERIAGERK